MRRRFLAVWTILAVAGTCACGGSDDPSDALSDDLPIVLDVGRDSAVPADPGTSDDVANADPAPADPGPTDSTPGDPNPLDPGLVDPGSRDDAGAQDDPGTTEDPGTTDPGTADDPGTAYDPGTTDDPGAPFDPGPLDDGIPPCMVGTTECYGGAATNGKTCATATIVGRWMAFSNGFQANPSNEDDVADNNDDLPTDAGTECRDGGNDIFYRVYLKAGETFSILLGYHPTIDMMAKIYRGTNCQANERLRCLNDNLDGPDVGSPPVSTEAEIHSFIPDADGWYTIVFDGRTSEDQGKSLVQFRLFNCADVDCCCN